MIRSDLSLLLRKGLAMLPVAAVCLSLAGCFDDKESLEQQYASWKAENETYVAEAEGLVDEDGNPFYSRMEPSWAPTAAFLIHWFNDPSSTQSGLQPMDNSTVSITYLLRNIKGDTISSSYANVDSLYTSRPQNNIIGVWYALTNMHVGDSVRLVLPYKAGYGEMPYGSIAPYSTLVYDLKLKDVKFFEIP